MLADEDIDAFVLMETRLGIRGRVGTGCPAVEVEDDCAGLFLSEGSGGRILGTMGVSETEVSWVVAATSVISGRFGAACGGMIWMRFVSVGPELWTGARARCGFSRREGG